MTDFPPLDKGLATLQASSTVKDVLRDLHVQALTEAPYLSTDTQPKEVALDKFVALEPDKCAFVYCASSPLYLTLFQLHIQRDSI